MNPRSKVRHLRLYLKSKSLFLGHLRPREIRMEYHRRAGAIASHLREAGYSLEFTPDNPVGLLYARMNYDSR